ncbi:MAG TPA: TIGR00266 family protein [Clostridiales bacterium]|nr:TIGR00266 family protein [Clostridiales bacterium]
MRYEIHGEPLPVVTCFVNAGESLVTERGSMCWMTPNMKMQTSTEGGVGKAFGRMFTGESAFQNRYTAMDDEGMIAFASSFPGSIRALDISPGNGMIVQKTAFLASELGVDLSVHFQKKLGAGFFGGEGFIMQKLSGNGVAFIEIDGYAMEYDLAAGQSMIIDTGYLAAMTESCKMDVTAVKGVKNIFLGGEGLFNTVVTGPGKIILQTMPISSVANSILKYIPTKS